MFSQTGMIFLDNNMAFCSLLEIVFFCSLNHFYISWIPGTYNYAGLKSLDLWCSRQRFDTEITKDLFLLLHDFALDWDLSGLLETFNDFELIKELMHRDLWCLAPKNFYSAIL